MANDINTVTLIGRLTRDPELRTLPSGMSLCQLGLAVNENYKDSSTGEWTERVNFFDITVWGNQGESCANYLSKGRQVCVEGRLRWESWENQEGQKRSKVAIVANRVQFLGGQPDRDPEPDIPIEPVQQPVAQAVAVDDDIPFLWRPEAFEDRYEHGSHWTPKIM